MTTPSFDGRSTEIKEHERRAAVILDGMCQFVALLNPRGDILEVNRAALEGAGHRIEEIRGKPFWTARWWQISEQIRQDLRSAIKRAAAGEFVRYEVDIYGEQSGLVPITIDFSLQPIRGESGEVEYLLPEGRNITGRKRAEEPVASQAAEFQRLNVKLQDSRRAALNMLEDAVQAKEASAKSETALRDSEERFRRLLDTLPVGAYTCDSEGLITYFNERAVEAWGRAPKLNDPVERFCGSYKLYSSDGELIPHDQCWMALAIKEKKACEGREIVIERPDGSRLTVLAHVNPFYNEAGNLLGAVNIVVDISDRKQAQEVIARMAAIVESSDDAIIGKDLNGIILSWNQGAQKIFGYTAEEVIGKSIMILIPPDRENEESYILDRIRRGERVVHYETVRLCKENHEIYVSLTISPIRDKAGKIIGASKIARDISERKRIDIEREELLRKESASRAEAEAANRSKDEFLAVVSHELRSPLNAILGYNHMLRENAFDAARLKSSCDVIERNAKTQLQLIEDLLDTARIVSGKLRLELRPLDINPVLADALDVVRPSAEAKGVRLQIADCGSKIEDRRLRIEDCDVRSILDPQSSILNPRPSIVLGDAARLQQIVWNLLSNAIKFTPAGGRVELRAERDEGHIRITISDTGKGIRREVLPHVFDRFRQADSSGSQRHGGLGLGLALVKHLVELHGGTVVAASDGAGCGSTFTVTLPLATQSELVTAEPSALALAAGVNGEAQAEGAILLPAGITIAGMRVLVVDDQEEARDSLTDFLSRYGAVVTTASSGAEALAILSDPPDGARPDILVCDIAMPEEDGYAALRRMRALDEARGVAASQRIPAIALTALSGSEDRLRALSSGFQMHVAKPADPVELIIVIDNVARMWWQEASAN